jgi:hypothetical protein
MYMLIQVTEKDVAAAAAAVSGFVIGEPLLLEQWSPGAVRTPAGGASTAANVGVRRIWRSVSPTRCGPQAGNRCGATP